jgi:hypothetical protein
VTMRAAIWRRRILRCVLVGVPALVVAVASCTEGAAPVDPVARVTGGSPGIAICTSTQVRGAAAAVTDAPVDADTTIDAGSGTDASTMDCKGLDIFETSISLEPAASGSAHVQSVTGFVDSLVLATITGDASFMFESTMCQPQTCDFSAMPVLLDNPYPLGIKCTATDGQIHTATLSAYGPNGPSDVDTAVLTCAASTNVPLIDVAPQSIDAGDVLVGASHDDMFTVTNNGTATLLFSVMLPPDWQAPGLPCVYPQPRCPIAAGGGSMVVPVKYAPSAYGPNPGTILIDSNAGMRSIGVSGTGIGSYISVSDPQDFDIDFGTIPRNSTATRPIAVSAVGNLQVSLAAGDPGAPFSITPPQLTLVPGVPQSFTVGCSSPTATGARSSATVLTSMDAYGPPLSAITLHCEVANTQVSVAPNQFDFAEVRKGTPAPALPFTISNPGPFAATITAVALAGAPPPLSLSLDGGGFPRTLQIGDSITGRLSLATDADVDLAQGAPKLAISVDGEQLLYPVTGKVTTPAAYVSPEKLELGTVCIGTGASATVSMINSGTARLTMDRPEVDPAFALQLQSPPSYPAPLLAGTMATLAVIPVAQNPGELTGGLTWRVDAPGSPFVVPVSLAFIETGTAISPASLTFSTVNVGEISPRYTVTLQNCSTTPVAVTVEGVTSTRGGIAAWKVDPSRDSRTLAPQDKLTISVAFAPLRRGHHVAQLELGVDGERRFVLLDGDGIDLDFKLTSFYACGCSTPRVRSGWPIVLAIALVVLRPRRRRRARRAPVPRRPPPV